MLLYILAVLAGFALLIWSADRFVDGAAAIAEHFNVPILIVGMVIVGFGTSAPEMLVSGVAAVNGNMALGIGNALGSNIANIGLVLGATAIFKVLPVQSSIIGRELPILLVATVIAFALLYFGTFSRIDGAILLIGLGLVLYWMIYSATNQPEPLADTVQPDTEEKSDNDEDDKPVPMFWAFAGLVLLLVSSNMLVWGATHIAEALGVSSLVIGLTIVAIGTSLPELAASISGALKGETDLAIGNIIGSNIFNTLAVLAIPALISPGSPPIEAIKRDMPVVLGLTVLLLIFSRGYFSRQALTRWKGVVLLLCFVAYNLTLYQQSTRVGTCENWFCF